MKVEVSRSSLDTAQPPSAMTGMVYPRIQVGVPVVAVMAEAAAVVTAAVWVVIAVAGNKQICCGKSSHLLIFKFVIAINYNYKNFLIELFTKHF